MTGTCTGEHGIGLGKRMYLEAELGKPTIDLLKNIKALIDPQNIFNVCPPCEFLFVRLLRTLSAR